MARHSMENPGCRNRTSGLEIPAASRTDVLIVSLKDPPGLRVESLGIFNLDQKPGARGRILVYYKADFIVP